MSGSQDLVLQLFYGRWRSQTMHAGIALGIFETIGPSPVDGAQVAGRLGLNPALTRRLLRALASLGLLRSDDGRAFAATAAGELLRSDHPQSMRDAVLLREGKEHTAIWKHLPAIVRDGRQDGFAREFGMPAFEYAAREPAYGAAFDAGMSSQSNLQTQWTLQALHDYDFGTVGHLCDVGGGQGHLLCHLLLRHPHLRGTIVERAAAASPGRVPWAERLGVTERCTRVAGDMFVDVPPADAYIMKMILHYWNDEECIRILRNLRRRVGTPGRLFVVEHVIPDTGKPDFAALFDMHMMCWGTGQERTAAEYRGLIEESGWHFAAVRYAASEAIGVVEATAEQ